MSLHIVSRKRHIGVGWHLQDLCLEYLWIMPGYYEKIIVINLDYRLKTCLRKCSIVIIYQTMDRVCWCLLVCYSSHLCYSKWVGQKTNFVRITLLQGSTNFRCTIRGSIINEHDLIAQFQPTLHHDLQKYRGIM